MSFSRPINTLFCRYPLAGPVAWVVSLQFFVVQLIAARAWTGPSYSLTRNTISDLGVTTCGVYQGQFVHNQFVCSPFHIWMNISLIVLGITMIIGAVLIYQEFRDQLGSAIGFGFMGVAGLGTAMVGLFPENTVSSLHILGAALPFVVGNIGMVVLGLSLAIPRPLRYYTIGSGVVALVALMLLLSNQYLGIGVGGIERFTAYPQTVWLIVFGGYLLRKSIKRSGFAITN